MEKKSREAEEEVKTNANAISKLFSEKSLTLVLDLDMTLIYSTKVKVEGVKEDFIVKVRCPLHLVGQRHRTLCVQETRP